MSKLTTGSFSIEGLESVQISIVGAAKEAAEEKAKELVKAGLTLFPGLESYRDDWNFKLLDRYEPVVTSHV